MNFIKMGNDTRIVEVDKLVRSHAMSHIDKFKSEFNDPEFKEQYTAFCNTRDTDAPVIGDKVREIAEYWYMRRDLERYVHVWDLMLRNYDPDVKLFTL